MVKLFDYANSWVSDDIPFEGGYNDRAAVFFVHCIFILWTDRPLMPNLRQLRVEWRNKVKDMDKSDPRALLWNAIDELAPESG